MSARAPVAAASRSRWRPLPRVACWEFIALGTSPADADWPLQPGRVLRAADGRAALLHFAPGRWLVPDPDGLLRARLEASRAAGAGVLVDVSGKWQEVALAPGVAGAVLASGIEVESLLRGREAAAVTLFDCPTILARAGTGFELWVAASYLHSFTGVIDALRLRD